VPRNDGRILAGATVEHTSALTKEPPQAASKNTSAASSCSGSRERPDRGTRAGLA
jgi:hypothetical protein